MFCKRCGAKNSKKLKHCGQCGAPLFESNNNANYQGNNVTQPIVDNSQKSATTHLHILLYITVAILMIIVLVLGGILIFGNNKKKGENTNTVTNINTDTNNNNNVSEEAYIPIKYKNTKVGDYITFGEYEQDNVTSNGKEDIEWLVLEKKDSKALVISKYALDCKPYNEKYENITWEDCTLREWLNDDFLNAAFSANEQAAIQEMTVPAEDHPKNGTDAGNDTKDKIFLLSISEAEKYFSSDDDRICSSTKYAKAQGVYNSNNNCYWWLRSPADKQNSAVYVATDGYLFLYTYDNANKVNDGNNAVRPAMWVTLES